MESFVNSLLIIILIKLGNGWALLLKLLFHRISKLINRNQELIFVYMYISFCIPAELSIFRFWGDVKNVISYSACLSTLPLSACTCIFAKKNHLNWKFKLKWTGWYSTLLTKPFTSMMTKIIFFKSLDMTDIWSYITEIIS